MPRDGGGRLTATAPQQPAKAGRERWTWKERSLLAAAVLLVLGAATLWLAEPNVGPDPAGSANTGVASVPTTAASHAAMPTSPSAPAGSHRSADPVAPPLPAADAAASAVALPRVQESENSMPLQAAAPKSGAADAAQCGAGAGRLAQPGQPTRAVRQGQRLRALSVHASAVRQARLGSARAVQAPATAAKSQLRPRDCYFSWMADAARVGSCTPWPVAHRSTLLLRR